MSAAIAEEFSERWHVVRRVRILGRPEVASTVVSHSGFARSKNAVELAKTLALLMSNIQGGLVRELATNTFQYDTVLGNRVTYQAQPISWKV